MNTDMCFDHVEATRDFGFSPRGFEFQLDESEPTWKDSKSCGYAR
jgi:hypothetical protein